MPRVRVTPGALASKKKGMNLAEKYQLKRRDFFKITAGALGICLSADHIYPSLVHSKEEKWPKKISKEVQHLLKEMEAHSNRYWSVPKKDGQFLNFFIRAMRAKKALEVGTSQGYSAIWMGLALKETGGHLTTIEIERSRFELAKKYVNQAGLENLITLIIGDAHQEITRLTGPFDFVFLDADKEGQVDYFQKLYPHKIMPGGVIAVHNAIHYANSMQDYLDLVRHHADFDSIIVSATLEDGFLLSYRLPK